MKTLASLLLSLSVAGIASRAAETNGSSITLSREVMTPALFKQIVQLPGDSTPLIAQLARIPVWTNATVSNVMTYASGKVFTEEMTQRTRTIRGKYIVATVHSKYYNQSMSSVLTFDEKASVLKVYSLFADGHGGDMLTEGKMSFDFSKKTYAVTSSYGDGFKETTTGVYADTEDTARTEVYQNGGLFMRREIVTRPVTNRTELPTR